jgi:hypothetical protein
LEFDIEVFVSGGAGPKVVDGALLAFFVFAGIVKSALGLRIAFYAAGRDWWDSIIARGRSRCALSCRMTGGLKRVSLL